MMRLIDYKAILLTLEVNLMDFGRFQPFFTLSFDDFRYVKDFVFKLGEDFKISTVKNSRLNSLSNVVFEPNHC